MSRYDPTPDWKVLPVKAAGLALIVALVAGACVTGWGDQPATRQSEGEAMLLVFGIIIGIAMILYEPDL